MQKKIKQTARNQEQLSYILGLELTETNLVFYLFCNS